MIIFGLPKEVVKTEPAGDDQRQALVQFGGDFEDLLIEALQSESLRGLIHYHLGLLLVEELPNLVNGSQVVSRHFVELPLRGI